MKISTPWRTIVIPPNGGLIQWEGSDVLGPDHYNDVKHAALIIKQAAEIKDPELRKAVSAAAGEYLAGKVVSEKLGPNENIIFVV